MKHLTFLLMVFLSCNAMTQQSVISVDVEEMEDEVYRSEYGPNREHFNLFYYSTGVSWDYESSDVVLSTIPHRSFEFTTGYMHKIKMNNAFSFIASNHINFKNIRLKENGQIWTGFQDFSKEAIFFYQYGVFTSLRVNFDARRRGNFIGFYADLGFFGNLNFLRRHRAVEKPEGFLQLARQKGSNNNPSYLEWYEFGPELRIGKGFFAIYTRYRLNTLIKNNLAEGRGLPKFTSGMVIYFE